MMNFWDFADKHIFALVILTWLVLDFVEFMFCILLGKKKIPSMFSIMLGSFVQVAQEELNKNGKKKSEGTEENETIKESLKLVD